MKPRALLLNPPGSPLILRDDYCSSTSKAGYAWPAIDLICQSGHLAPHVELTLMDPTTQGIDEDRCLDDIRRLRPDWIFTLAASIRLEEDLGFLERVAENTSAKVVIGGDWARFHAAELLARRSWAHAVVTDFTGSGLIDEMLGRSGGRQGLYRRGDPPIRRSRAEFDYPIPRHDLFARLPYYMPFLGRRFASILTAYGCPYACTFCNSGDIGYARRSIDGLFLELEHLRAEGVRSLYVKDFTFNAEPERTKDILRRWIERRFPFRWTAFLRAESIDGELASLLKRAGCRAAQVGIETMKDEALLVHKPAFDRDSADRGLALLEEAGVAWGAHFLFGLPGDDAEGYRRTLEWAQRRNPLYASFNVFGVRPGTRLEKAPDRVGDDGDSHRIAVEWAERAHREFYRQPARWVRVFRESISAGSTSSIVSMGLRRLLGKAA